MARQPVGVDELVQYWTVLGDELELVAGKRGGTRLGFGLLLKYFTRHGRFPRGGAEFPDEVVEFVARQLEVPAAEFESYQWVGSTIEYHRAQIRGHLGFRACSVQDAEKLTAWLATNVAHAERNADRVREELLKHCREESIEPPAPDRITRMVRSALHTAEETWFATVAARLVPEVRERILTLVAAAGDTDEEDADDGESVLALIKAMPGNVSLESMLREIRKLTAIRAIGLPASLFADVAPQVLASWRARAAVESPSHLRRRSQEAAVTLLSALLVEREREVTDSLVDLLIATVHRTGARAEQKVTNELINAFKRVTGKENILFRIAEASLAQPDGEVREVVFPAAGGGEQTLKELVHEYRTKGPVYRHTVQTTLKASYTSHYRKGLIELLEVLEFRSNNSAYRPVIDALALVQRYAKAGNTTYYPLGETAPEHRVTTGQWAELVYRADKRGRRRIVRMVYEVATFQALREQLRCKEIWVVGAGRWRNPDEDLPTDFEARRVEHYNELRKPLDPAVFITSLREEMTEALAGLDEALPGLGWVEIKERKAGAIRFTAPEASEEPRNLRRVKNEVGRRWNAVPLIDMLKEALLRTGCLTAVTSVVGSGHLAPEVLAERLMLAIYAYGTNAGIRSVAGGEHGHTEEEIRYVRRRYLTLQAARQIAIEIANATFAERETGLWGTGSTAVASDSTHFRSWDQNLFTEWHSRYGGRGILVYWHVERGSVVVHSQTLRASASEVAAMVEGAIRHGTTMSVEGNYVDSHGQSEIGFGITRLLNVDLLPRIKQINRVRLYRPNAGEPGAYPNLQAALTRPIRWDLIDANYDQVIKYATAIRTGTASTEAILSRFTRAALHPAYQAMLEIGRAQRTVFLARYLRDRDLQREIEEGLNVVESWNAANAVIYYGKGGEISTNRREEIETAALCLRILQASLVYVNTLMLQDVLVEPQWSGLLTPADRRGLTPLFWSHVRPDGEVRLDLGSRLAIGPTT
ncbi:Tn3 family transposase [Pseudofrankia sp. BMG5.37]|uniref:Tn3 family transposase n=1 Tax=Pseudofrankia sp. BMG5.37 TaxID=3050035 RepID=UPI0028948A8D|nr:Tn3 family transposase [Pseudofrankia sp. BMG5.37]MDT3441581.1 Tn3 family transposase [Pseudofrankia sp. BMG5.37]